ncbi:MAG: hypothetical protein IT369_07565 [Candidatus Latescibacteria bacterium]|nr:hypothetical protein [Candidatus Latescibacterota bacterium]
MELYAEGEAWYLMGEGGKKGWCWRRGDEGWSVKRADLPAGASRARVEDLPGSLQEEVLAFAGRAAAMGPQP